MLLQQGVEIQQRLATKDKYNSKRIHKTQLRKELLLQHHLNE